MQERGWHDDVVKLGWFAQRPDQTRNRGSASDLGCVVVAVLAAISLRRSPGSHLSASP